MEVSLSLKVRHAQLYPGPIQYPRPLQAYLLGPFLGISGHTNAKVRVVRVKSKSWKKHWKLRFLNYLVFLKNIPALNKTATCSEKCNKRTDKMKKKKTTKVASKIFLFGALVQCSDEKYVNVTL